jgi:hypothetical protein
VGAVSATAWSTSTSAKPCIHCGTATKGRNRQDRPAHESCETRALERERVGVRDAMLASPWAVS